MTQDLIDLIRAAAEHLKEDRPHRIRVGGRLMTNVELANALLSRAADEASFADLRASGGLVGAP